MKVLSVQQPWAWAIIHGGKDVENRDWRCRYRGPLAIHASKAMPRDFGSEYYTWPGDVAPPLTASLVLGAILGVVDVVDCVEESDSPWFSGRYGIVLRRPRPLQTPIPARGFLGLWAYEGLLEVVA